jgi:hypothetical protein
MQDMMGHSTCQKVVNFPGSAALKGSVVRVRITEAKTNSLYGELDGARAEAAPDLKHQARYQHGNRG